MQEKRTNRFACAFIPVKVSFFVTFKRGGPYGTGYGGNLDQETAAICWNGWRVAMV